MNKGCITFMLLLAFVTNFTVCRAQQITGAWKGKINNQRVELKIINSSLKPRFAKLGEFKAMITTGRDATIETI
jgi:hypothetical protein